MNNELFNTLIAQIREKSVNTLACKNAMYSTEDKLHNFRVGADMMGGTPAQACWGYLTKHLVALRDKVERNDFSDLDDLMEKCIDTINYTAFLWCIGYEEWAKTHDNNVVGLGLTPEEREVYCHDRK